MANPTIAVRAQFDEIRSLAAASIVPTYVAVGTPFDFPAHVVLFQNLTDEAVFFTNDPAPVADKVDKFILPAQSGFVLDCTTNKGMAKSFFLPVNEQWYVRESGVPTTGSVYISVLYGEL